jgi:hypothetical protein
MAVSITDLKYIPDPMVAGSKVKAMFKVASDEEIESVKVYDPEYRVFQAYDDGSHGDEVAGDGVYTLEADVPYDAPSGNYDVTVVVTDKTGKVERKTVSVEVG